ncbi:MAG TPA: rhomboid family intramembrane serine protease [Phycisphaeraceae bacterium]
MFFPIRTDRPLRSLPWVNYALIGANVVIFLATYQQVQFFDVVAHMLRGFPLEHLYAEAPVGRFYLWPTQPMPWQFISYQFLHADWMHLLGNMVFLYVFGNHVEDRLGKVGYLFFYLAGGVFAGLGHALVQTTPVIGASGAVSAVTGAYLALFPLSNVTIVYWFFFVGTFEVSSMVLILFQIAENLIFQFTGVGNVAYLAHLAGYAYGFVIGMGLLLARVLPREPYDMLSLIERRRRRASFQRLARRGYHPWEHAGADQPAAAGDTPELTAFQRELAQLREGIGRAIAEHDLPAAARQYRQLLQRDPRQVMSLQQQLDLANQLMAEGRYDTAAAAYELFLGHFGDYPQREQVQLILGLVYARYLREAERARQLLQAALPRLSGSDRELAQQTLEQLKNS